MGCRALDKGCADTRRGGGAMKVPWLILWLYALVWPNMC